MTRLFGVWKEGETMAETTGAASALLGGDGALNTAVRRIFGSSGNVLAGYGSSPTAWSGGMGTIDGPSSYNPYKTFKTTGQGRITGMSFPETTRVDYAKIAEEANKAANGGYNGSAGGLAEANYQKNLLENAKKWVNDINTSGDLNNSWKQAYRAGNYGLGGASLARHNYDTAKAGLDGLTADEKAWLATQGVTVPSKYPEFHL
jgi:hypothetical protein